MLGNIGPPARIAGSLASRPRELQACNVEPRVLWLRDNVVRLNTGFPTQDYPRPLV